MFSRKENKICGGNGLMFSYIGFKKSSVRLKFLEVTTRESLSLSS